MAEKAIVFGGSGFLGQHLIKQLIKNGTEVVFADIKNGPDFAEFYRKVDIMDYRTVVEVIPAGCDFVFNFAGLSDLNDSLKKPLEALNLNTIANINILKACTEKKAKRVIYSSSVYANSSAGSFYGISKKASEAILQEYYRQFGLEFNIFRYGSLYGPGADDTNGMYRMLRQAVEKREIDFLGDGEEIREYIHVRDAAVLTLEVVKDPHFINKCVTLTGVERFKQKEVLSIINEIMESKLKISLQKKDYKGHYSFSPYSFTPDYAVKITPKSFVDFGQGILECITQIYQQNQK